MRHPDYPDFICDISERNFWGELRASRGRGETDLLQRAIRLGRAGKKSAAYEQLAEYHRHSLRGEWEHLQQHGPPAAIHCAPQQTAADVVRHYLSFSPAACRQYGMKIDWNQPATGSIIDCFYWYLPLVRAYMENPKESYRQALGDLVSQYYTARNQRHFPSPHYHPVYSALSGSVKLRHILTAYVALAARGGLDAPATESFLKLALGIARALYRRETDFVLSNQIITNAEGFGMFAALFPEFSESAALRERALQRILRNVEEGFLPDGGYYERSFDYSGVAIRDSTRAVLTMERAAPLRPAIRRRFEKVFRNAGRFWARTLGPDDWCPPYADGYIQKGTEFLGRLLPFFPPGAPAGFGEDRSRSHLFPDTGFAVCRAGAAREDAYLFFSFARCDLWHSHQDCLTFDFWRYGRPLLLEAGRFGLYEHPQSRLLRLPELHNTLTVGGQTWDERQPDLWRGEDVRWLATPEFDYITAAHRAYQGDLPVSPQAQNYRLRRAIIFVKKAGYVLVHDSVDNQSAMPVGVIAQHWHAPRPFRVTGPGCARTNGPGGVLTQTVATGSLRRTETGVDYLPEEVVVKNAFPERYWLRFQRWGDSSTGGPQGFVTVIVPFQGRPPKIEVKIQPVRAGIPWQAECVTVRTPVGVDRFIFNPDLCPGVGRGKVILHGQSTVLLP